MSNALLLVKSGRVDSAVIVLRTFLLHLYFKDGSLGYVDWAALAAIGIIVHFHGFILLGVPADHTCIVIVFPHPKACVVHKRRFTICFVLQKSNLRKRHFIKSI